MDRSSSSGGSVNPALSRRSDNNSNDNFNNSIASPALIDPRAGLHDRSSSNYSGIPPEIESIDANAANAPSMATSYGSEGSPCDSTLMDKEQADKQATNSSASPSLSHHMMTATMPFASGGQISEGGQTSEGGQSAALNIEFRSSFVPPADSEPHTPIDQIPPPPGHLPYESKPRFGSVSSIATTDDDDAVTEILYPWTTQQDNLVRRTYEDVVNRPQITPFSGRYPPSGVLHRVAKDTLKMAKHEQIVFPHSINAVRRRVLVLYKPSSESWEELEKYKMSQDYFSITPQNETHYQSSPSQQPHCQPFTAISAARGQPRIQQPIFAGQFAHNNGMNNNSGRAGDEEFEFSDAMSSSRRMSVEEKYSARSNSMHGSSTTNAFAYPDQTSLASGLTTGLAAPFRETRPTAPSSGSYNSSLAKNTAYPSGVNANSTSGQSVLGQSVLSEEDVVNIVAKRKRDSLRMKRGQF